MNKRETKSRDRLNARRSVQAIDRAKWAIERFKAGAEIEDIARGLDVSVKTTRRYITSAGHKIEPVARGSTCRDMKATEVAICELLNNWKRPEGQDEALAESRPGTVRFRNLRAIAAHYANACAGAVR